MNPSYGEMADFILSFRGSDKEIQIFPHIRVDGDCLGSAAAVTVVMEELGIRSRIFLSEPIPENLLFMGIPTELYEIYNEKEHTDYCMRQTAAMAVDCSCASRMGNAGKLFSNAKKEMIIDHHLIHKENTVYSHQESTPKTMNQCNLILPEMSSTAEVIFYLIRNLEQKTGNKLVNQKIANYLMIGIQSDTGRFSYQNTTPSSLRVAADLMENGANVYENSISLFEASDILEVQMIAEILSAAQFYENGKIAVAVVLRETLNRFGANEGAIEGLAGTLRNMRGVVISIVLRELEQGDIRGNIRTNEPLSAAELARSFAGGGHQNAAGFVSSKMEMNDLIAAMVKQAQLNIRKSRSIC